MTDSLEVAGIQRDAPARSANRQIFSAMLVVGGFTVVAKLVFVARDLVIAREFGTSQVLDAYLLAFTLPSFATSVIAGSLNVALIPTLIHVHEQQGRPAAQRLLSNALAFNATVLSTALILLTALLPYGLPLLGSHFTPEAIALSRSVSYVLLPILLVSGFSTTWAAVLNADDRFAAAAIAPAVTALLPIPCLIWASPSHRVYALAGGTLAGYVGEATVIGIFLSRRGFFLFPRWHGLDANTKAVIRQYIPMVAGALIQSGTTLVNQALAGMLGSGVMSSLNYGTKIVSLVSGIGALTLTTAMLPHFSRMVALSDLVGLRHTLRTYGGLVLVGSLPIVAAIVYFSRPLVTLVYRRGAFSAHDVDVVAPIQAAYVLQIPPYLLGMLGVRLVSSFKANHILLWGSMLALTVNCVLGYVLARSLGAVGIALTTSVVYLATCTFVIVMVTGLLKQAQRSVPVALP